MKNYRVQQNYQVNFSRQQVETLSTCCSKNLNVTGQGLYSLLLLQKYPKKIKFQIVSCPVTNGVNLSQFSATLYICCHAVKTLEFMQIYANFSHVNKEFQRTCDTFFVCLRVSNQLSHFMVKI